MTDQRLAPVTREAVVADIERTRNLIEAVVAECDAETMVVPADAGGWNLRDHLAHITAWGSTRIALLCKMQPWDAFGISESEFRESNIDELNDILRNLTRNLSPNEVLEMFRETSEALLDELARTTDDVLTGSWVEFHPSWTTKSNATADVLGIFWYGTAHHYEVHYKHMRHLLEDTGS